MEKSIMFGYWEVSEKEFSDNLNSYKEEYDRIILDISNNPLRVAKKNGCNHGRFYICKTKEQFDRALEILFQETSKQADDFIEFSSKNVVYDGSIFWNTDSLLEYCKSHPNDYSSKYGYLKSFGYVGDGIFFERVIDQPHYTTYLEF